MTQHEFTHLDESGKARMVDVTAKEVTARQARARAKVVMSSATAAAVSAGDVAKGDVLAVARVAGIQAAKKASELIPLCHPLMIGGVTVDFEVVADGIEIEAVVETVDRTGVEMEAMTACSVAALTIYDMCKSSDKSIVITDVALWEKSGGKSGLFRRED